MTILYDIVTADDLIELSIEEKISLVSEIILNGKMIYFEKFKSVLDDEVTKFISSSEMLKLLPLNIDPELLNYLMEHYTFDQGQHFFYNYALNTEDMRVREIVYNYFVENYSHVLIDNMNKYEVLLEENNKNRFYT